MADLPRVKTALKPFQVIGAAFAFCYSHPFLLLVASCDSHSLRDKQSINIINHILFLNFNDFKDVHILAKMLTLVK